jgi:hypothetical protein
VRGVFSDGFQTMLLPQTSASAAFHDQTATGKLNAEMMPVTPSGCQVSRHAMFVAFGGDRQAVELAGKPHSVVANIDHLLDFAEAFGLDLAGLNGNQLAERALVGTKLIAKQPHKFATLGSRDQTPFEESRVKDVREWGNAHIACASILVLFAMRRS